MRRISFGCCVLGVLLAGGSATAQPISDSDFFWINPPVRCDWPVTHSREVTMKIVKMELDLVNDSMLLDEWERLWSIAYEARLDISRARQAKEPITLDMMQAYDKARNDERNYFWNAFFVLHKGM